MDEDIRCRCCGSTMGVDRRESERLTVTAWHSCPTCGHVRMTSEREDVRTVAHRAKALVDDSPDDQQAGFEF